MSKARRRAEVPDLAEAIQAPSTPEVPAEPVRLAELGGKLREKLWMLPGSSADNIGRAVDETLDVYYALGPQSVEEEMVAERMVLARAAANVCMKAAYSLAHTPEGARLGNMYRLFSEEELKWKREWDKGRGRADQVVRVVNVKDGGQAMIGNVHLAPKATSHIAQPKVEERLPPGVRAPRRTRAGALSGGGR